MSNVDTRHPDYDKYCAQWQLVEDAAAGENAVKCARETYLPRPNPTDVSPEATKRYDQYVARAVYYNATGRTLRTMVGMAFARDPAVTLPTGLAEYADNINGAGLKLNQQAQAALAEILKPGRAGLLTDFPRVENPAQTSLLVQRTGGLQPTISLYSAKSIINWRTTVIGGKTVLSLVVLAETFETVDGFALKSVPQRRALKLGDDGFYAVEIWRKVAAEDGGEIDWRLIEEFAPLDGKGNRLPEIPFQFIGAQNNDSTVDDSPLYDIATLNLAHYRNSADFEESAYFNGQPQFYMAGLTEEWRDTLLAKGVYIGSRTILPLPVGGSAGILQADPNTLAKDAMVTKEQQMAALGARLLFASIQVKTATQQNSEDTTSHSTLTLACANVSDAYVQALEWMALFAGASGTIKFAMQVDFTAGGLSDASSQLILSMQQGGLIRAGTAIKEWQRRGVLSSDVDSNVEAALAKDEQVPTDGEQGTGGPNAGA